jgi:hypothetical protein
MVRKPSIFNISLEICPMSENNHVETAHDNAPGEQLPAERKILPAAAVRALEEAEERRRKAPVLDLPEEVGGRGGADPARFGDWEINGRAVDF